MGVIDRVDEKVAAEVLGVAPRTLKRWRKNGTGPAYIRIGHRVYYPSAALENYLVDSVVFPEEQRAA